MNDAALQTQSRTAAAEVFAWLRRYRKRIDCSVARIPFADSDEWRFDEDRSALRHVSGRFFAIGGYQGSSKLRPTFYQPLINQPETGVQGFVVRQAGRDHELLVQARTEPGNIGLVQVGPTIQATYSNYTQAHGGKTPLFLEHFLEPARHGARVILDTVQPELGTKFLHKWNRNIVIECPELAEFDHPMFRWISLRSLAQLMRLDHVVNNDARLVFGLLALELGPKLFSESRSPWGAAAHRSFQANSGKSFADVDQAADWLRQSRLRDTLDIAEVSLNELPGWRIGSDEIVHEEGLFFSVVQVKVHATDREVTDWDQPLFAAGRQGKVMLVCQEQGGVLNLLFRAAPQIGAAGGVELLPTVCFDNEPEAAVPVAIADLLKEERCAAALRFEASEEGGRFYQYVNRYDLRWLRSSADAPLPANYCWLTLQQVRALVDRSDFVSDESRSAVSLLLAAAYGD